VLECIRLTALADRLGQERLLHNARAVIKKYQDRDVPNGQELR
jgi:hypothetical protein